MEILESFGSRPAACLSRQPIRILFLSALPMFASLRRAAVSQRMSPHMYSARSFGSSSAPIIVGARLPSAAQSSSAASSPAADRVLRALAAESLAQRRTYESLFREHGAASHKALHWDSAEGQTRRFDALLELLREPVSDADASANTAAAPAADTAANGVILLDVGCGLGDLVSHVHTRHHQEQLDRRASAALAPSALASEAALPAPALAKLPARIDVLGVDIVAEFVAAARARHPHAHFLCRDLFSIPSDEATDALRDAAVELRRRQTHVLVSSPTALPAALVADLAPTHADAASGAIDYGICSGMFAFGTERFFVRALRLLVPQMRRGFAFNIHETQDDRFLKLSRKVLHVFVWCTL